MKAADLDALERDGISGDEVIALIAEVRALREALDAALELPTALFARSHPAEHSRYLRALSKVPPR